MLRWGSGAQAAEVLRLRTFRRFALARSISVLGDRMMVVALAFAALELGASATQVGLVLAAAAVPLVLSVFIGGVVADRVRRRDVMIAADVLRLVTQGTSAALLLTGSATLWALAALAAATAIGDGFFNPASTGLLPELVEDEQLQAANATLSSATSAAEILGPAVAGAMVALGGAGIAIAVDAATFAVSALLLLGLPSLAIVAPKTRLVDDWREGWTTFRSTVWLWTFVVYFALANTLWAAWVVLGPLAADDHLGGAQAWGIVLSCMGVGLLLGSAAAAVIHPSRPLIFVAISDVLFAVPVAMLALGVGLPWLCVAALVSGFGAGAGTAVWISTMQRHVPRDQIARMSSYDWFGSFAFYPLGMAMWGPIAAAAGVGTALGLASAVWVVLLVAVLLVPTNRRLTAPDSTAQPHAAT
jgi:MFS family permease